MEALYKFLDPNHKKQLTLRRPEACSLLKNYVARYECLYQVLAISRVTLLQSIFTEQALTILRWFTPVIAIALAHSLWQLRTRLWTRNMLMLNIAVSAAFLLVSIGLLMLSPVLQINVEVLREELGIAIIERSAQTILVAAALIATYEIVRDARRLVSS